MQQNAYAVKTSSRVKRNRRTVLRFGTKAEAEMSPADLFWYTYGIKQTAPKTSGHKRHYKVVSRPQSEQDDNNEKLPYRESNPAKKQELRLLLCKVLRQLPPSGDVVILDSEIWSAAKQFIARAHIDPKRICAPQNYYPSFLLMKGNMPRGMPLKNLQFQSMSVFLDATDQQRRFFRFFWCDFCKTFSGQKQKRKVSARADIEHIFKNRMMLDNSALAITFSTRTEYDREEGLTREQQTKHLSDKYLKEIKAMAAKYGYHLKNCEMVSHYPNTPASEIVTLLFYVYQQV